LKAENHYSNKHKVEWEYIGKVGPKYWGDLSPEFKMCKIGKQQSSIDIIPTKTTKYKPFKIDYKSSATIVVNNGHTVKVSVKKGSYMVVDGKKYELEQFHFHTPSENYIRGIEYPFKAHFVHISKDGIITVIGVMFKEGKENKVLSKIWLKFPLKKGEKVHINLSANDINNLLPKNREYYKFMGSLTTPPCTEGVTWIVFKTSGRNI